MSALSPCPFCGCAPTSQEEYQDGPPQPPDGECSHEYVGWLITCDCDAGPNVFQPTEREAIAVWNRRT